MLAAAIEVSLPELRPWMPWAAAEPLTLDDRVELLRRFRGEFDLGQNYVYGIFDHDEQEVVGGTGLHPRLDGNALEIGYWIRSDRAGRGLAAEAAAVLTRVAVERLGVDRVEIRTDPANERSRAIPRRLGYKEEATLRRRLAHPEPRDVVVYSMFADELAGTDAARAEYDAFDVAGRPLP